MISVFSTSDVPKAERFGYWHDAVRQSYVRTGISSDCSDGFYGEIQSQSLHDLSLSTITAAPMLAERLARDARGSTPDVVFLQILVEGTSVVSQDGRESVVRAGEMCLVDPVRPYFVSTPYAKHDVLAMPRSALVRRVGDTRRVTARPISIATAEGGLAAGYIKTLLKGHAVSDNAAASALVSAQAVDLAALALTEGARETVQRLSSPVAVSRLRLHHAVEAHLRAPSVRCDDVAAMAGISARYANQLLTQEGTTLERLIMRRRLEECRAALADPAQAQRSIGDIARQHGFVTSAHFARCFKQMFGMSAREFRAEVAFGCVSAEPIPNVPATFLIPERR